LLSFGKASEIAVDRRPVEKKFLTPVVADEPESLVVHDPFNPSLRHNALLSSLSSLPSQEWLSAITTPGRSTLRLTAAAE
jgi:hypothetical protein